MRHGKKSIVLLACAVALGSGLVGCARNNSAAVVAAPVKAQGAPAPVAAAAVEGMPEVVVGASRGDEVEVVVKASKNNSKLVALSEHKAAH
jgi:type IV pilus biogenesis protein CpaD/CtpE